MQKPEFLSTRQAAARLSISARTLEKWRVGGAGPRYVKLGRAVRYPAAELDAFVLRQMRDSTSAEDRT